MNVLITGAAGQLGSALLDTAPDNVKAMGLVHNDFDITDPACVNAVLEEHEPSVVVNTAAFTAVDKAENEEGLAMQVNAIGPAYLAESCLKLSIRLVQISTDYIFDGVVNHPYPIDALSNPRNVYGRSKLEGEKAVREKLGSAATVIRTGWLYAVNGNNFVNTMLQSMQQGNPLRVVYDQIGAPTWAKSLAEMCWVVVERTDAVGVWHWSDAGTASWYDFAVAIQEEALRSKLLVEEIPIEPVRTSDYPVPALRPSYSVLDCSHAERVLNIKRVHWRHNLRSMFEEKVRA
ncbi:MAG: dTDP-4-dehydrorhamnose reductase [Gammaproteobacteria bacterium]|nr:dTDP-4-dehydrorhamnose reductase [Gammaproteobacteria bacterium]